MGSLDSLKILDNANNMLKKSINDPIIAHIANRIGATNFKTGPWIAGGVARRLWFGLPWHDHDVDVFFPNEQSFSKLNLKFLPKKHSSRQRNNLLISLLELFKPKFEIYSTPHFESNNAVTYKARLDPDDFTKNYMIQLIYRKYHSNVEALLDNFDITACKFATNGKEVIADPQAVEDCENKLIRINPTYSGTVHPDRLIKYGLYGFSPDPNLMINAIIDWEDVDDTAWNLKSLTISKSDNDYTF